MVEDSSEIASARVSSSYRKSMKSTKIKNKQQAVSIRNHSLCKISEENTDDNFNTNAFENKVNNCHVTFVCDDEKVTSDTSDGSKVSLERENAKNRHKTVSCKSNNSDCDRYILCEETDIIGSESMKENFLLSRFVPEFFDGNKITIV